MILYFDSYITDTPLNKNFVDPNKPLREAVAAYAMPSKIDIAKYTLASYASYPWSNVLIRYELEDKSRQEEFETYVHELFPNATILDTRSANQTEYKRSLAIIDEWDDEWIWYAPNNDHPITTHDKSIIDRTLQKASAYTETHPHISIPYSHFSEYTNLPRKNSVFWHLYGRDITILHEDDTAIVCTIPDGDNTAIQIVNKKLLRYWFSRYDLGDARIIRSEDVRKYFYTKNQLLIIPKKEIGAHFDGYAHTIGGLAEIAPEQVPPLFIPSGFFENDIRIKYGFSGYDPSYTNVSPAAKRYSFEDAHHGTDLKLTLERLPLFWKQRIKTIEKNPALSDEQAAVAMKRVDGILNDPYSLNSKELNLKTLKFVVRTIKHRVLPRTYNQIRKRLHSVLRRTSRFLKLHPSSSPYLSGDTFRTLAQHVHDMDCSVLPERVKSNDIVFVQSPRLNDFINNVHTQIKEPYVLITHNGDENITDEYLTFIESKTLIHWFAQNCLIAHCKITPLPIGLENKWYYLHGIPKYFDWLRKKTASKENKILYKFSVSTNPKERGEALKILETHPLAHTYTDWRQSFEYLQTLQQFTFVASPPGNGEDCIRTWEAMYLGSVPIVKRSAMTEYFERLGLPLLVLNDWNELNDLTPKHLQDLHAKMLPKFYNPALWADFWINEITNKRS